MKKVKDYNSLNSVINAPAQFKIFPNPAQNNVFIHADNSSNRQAATIQLLDLQGRILTEMLFSSNEIAIDLSTYMQGIYLVKVLSSELIFTQTLIISN